MLMPVFFDENLLDSLRNVFEELKKFEALGNEFSMIRNSDLRVILLAMCNGAGTEASS